jgi:signal peptidase I
MSVEVDVPTPESIESPTVARPGLSPHRGWWRDVLEVVALIVIIYTLVNLSTARAIVEGPSMQPNFYTGQLVIVNRFAYYFSEPQRGDVVVINNPTEPCKDFVRDKNVIEVPFLAPVNTNGQCEDLIKRVVGLPSETIQIKEGQAYVNGTRLEEPYIQAFCTVGCDGTWVLGAEQYFVLGDNRRNSYDSHQFGPISRHLIVGQAWIRYWPLPDAGIIPHPSYGQISSTFVPLPPTATPLPVTPVPWSSDFAPTDRTNR